MARVARFLVGLAAVGLIAAACTTAHHKSSTASSAPAQGVATPTTAANPATPSTAAGQGQGSTQSAQPVWSSNPVSKPGNSTGTGSGTLVAVRAARHDGYDRITFEFSDGRPGYTVRYVPQVVQDGSGAPITLLGHSFLSVVFMRAQAHDDSGAQTYTGPQVITTNFSSLKQAAFAGDFEGYVSFGLGLGNRVGFRVLELDNPARIAVDVAN
jgi:hypothetical protein